MATLTLFHGPPVGPPQLTSQELTFIHTSNQLEVQQPQRFRDGASIARLISRIPATYIPEMWGTHGVLLLLLTAAGCASAAGNCSVVEPNVCYTGPGHYAEVSNCPSADACCDACWSAAGNKCQSWTFNPKKDGGGCFLRGGPPTGRVNGTAARPCTSGTPDVAPTPAPSPPAPAPPGALNVLLIACDDLRPLGAEFGEPEALMPHLDQLAAGGTIFKHAYAQSPTCGVSRSSLLTGRRIDTTQVRVSRPSQRTLTGTLRRCSAMGAAHSPTTPTTQSGSAWHRASATAATRPAATARSGTRTSATGRRQVRGRYRAVRVSLICNGATAGEVANDWSTPYYHAPCISLGSLYNGTCYENFPFAPSVNPGGKTTSVFANASTVASQEVVEEDMSDAMIAASAVANLHALAAARDAALLKGEAARPSPFFMGVGFHKVRGTLTTLQRTLTFMGVGFHKAAPAAHRAREVLRSLRRGCDLAAPARHARGAGGGAQLRLERLRRVQELPRRVRRR